MTSRLTGYAGVCKECGAPHIWYGEQPKKCVSCAGAIDFHGIVVKKNELAALVEWAGIVIEDEGLSASGCRMGKQVLQPFREEKA